MLQVSLYQAFEHGSFIIWETCIHRDMPWQVLWLETCWKGIPVQILKWSAEPYKIMLVLRYQTRFNWGYLVYFQVVTSISEWSSMFLIQVSFRRSILDIISTCRSVETSCNAACCCLPVRLASSQATLCSVRSNHSCLCFWIIRNAVSVGMQLCFYALSACLEGHIHHSVCPPACFMWFSDITWAFVGPASTTVDSFVMHGVRHWCVLVGCAIEEHWMYIC